MSKINIQIITAAVLAIGGLVLLFCGVYIEPQGEIHDSLLIGFGEVATFAGALFGIDAAYTKKLWDITNSFAKNKDRQNNTQTIHKTQSAESSTRSLTQHEVKKHFPALPPPSKTPTT